MRSIKIQAVQEAGYGMFEYDILDANGYVGLVLGTETRGGMIWEVQRWRNGSPDGSVMRLSPCTFEEMMEAADSFLA